MYTGLNIERDGLVFGYDTGRNTSSGLDDRVRGRRHFKGRNTTNVVTNTNLNTGWSKGYQTAILYDEILPPKRIVSQVVGFNKSSASSYWYSYGNYAPQTPSTVYTVSMYVKTRDSNFRIKFYTADNQEAGRYNSSYITVPDDGEWHRVVWDSFTNPSNSQSDSLSFNFIMADTGDSSRTWFCAPQMEANPHVSPFVTGTRSSTQSLIDLTKTLDINVSNVSFGSDGLPEFDGSNDYIDLGADLAVSPINQGWTAEYIFNSDSASTLQHFNGCEEDVHNAGWLALYQSKLQVWNRSPGIWRKGSTVFASNTWYHVAFVQESGTSMQFYVNGVAEGGDHVTYSWNASKSAFFARYIGRYENAGSYSRYFNGHIPVAKFYNKGLSAAEVKQNFNSYRKRFNL